MDYKQLVQSKRKSALLLKVKSLIVLGGNIFRELGYVYITSLSKKLQQLIMGLKQT